MTTKYTKHTKQKAESEKARKRKPDAEALMTRRGSHLSLLIFHCAFLIFIPPIFNENCLMSNLKCNPVETPLDSVNREFHRSSYCAVGAGARAVMITVSFCT